MPQQHAVLRHKLDVWLKNNCDMWLGVSVSACLPVFLPACLPAYLPTCLLVSVRVLIELVGGIKRRDQRQ